MESHVPVAVVAATVSVYWLCVFVMVGRSWVRFRGPAGALPKTRRERWMWIVWVPNTAAWVAVPWIAWNRAESWLGQSGTLFELLRWPAAIVAVAALGLTSRCWLAMGSNWTMAVNPKKKTVLITHGPFAVVRHPIYALSLMLMVCTMVAIPAWPMWLVGGVHITLILSKVASEERYLRQIHGTEYEHYCRQTARLLPWRYLTRHRRRQAAA
jgi:protein-S-isoprenylcysteine O-methyltransferase Ste14